MKKLSLLLMILLIGVSLLGQESYTEPTYVSTAKYFDKFPPLRDMPIILPGERDRSWKDNII